MLHIKVTVYDRLQTHNSNPVLSPLQMNTSNQHASVKFVWKNAIWKFQTIQSLTVLPFLRSSSRIVYIRSDDSFPFNKS